jgi:hypothetical protein
MRMRRVRRRGPLDLVVEHRQQRGNVTSPERRVQVAHKISICLRQCPSSGLVPDITRARLAPPPNAPWTLLRTRRRRGSLGTCSEPAAPPEPNGSSGLDHRHRQVPRRLQRGKNGPITDAARRPTPRPDRRQSRHTGASRCSTTSRRTNPRQRRCAVQAQHAVRHRPKPAAGNWIAASITDSVGSFVKFGQRPLCALKPTLK